MKEKQKTTFDASNNQLESQVFFDFCVNSMEINIKRNGNGKLYAFPLVHQSFPSFNIFLSTFLPNCLHALLLTLLMLQ